MKTAATNVKQVGNVLELIFTLTVWKAVVIEDGVDGTVPKAKKKQVH